MDREQERRIKSRGKLRCSKYFMEIRSKGEYC